MISRAAFLASGLLGLVSSLAASDAAAQCRLCGTPSLLGDAGEAAGRVSVEVETSLAFDRVVVINEAGGTATLRPDGSRSVTGGLTDLSGRAMVGSAIIRGTPGKAVKVDLPRRIELHSLNGGLVLIEDVVSDLPDLPRLDSTGKLSFRFGGQLKVSGDADGDYRGELPIFVDYL